MPRMYFLKGAVL